MNNVKKQEFILIRAGTKFQVKKKPMAGSLGHLLIGFSITGRDEPTLPADPVTIKELILWAAGLVEHGYGFEP